MAGKRWRFKVSWPTMQIKIRKSDTVFSIYIRTKAGWTCERCFTTYEPGSSSLHCSHFHGRGRESTRFDPENCNCLCFGCHRYFHSYPLEYVDWKRKKMGENEFKILEMRSNQYKKRDDKMDLIRAKALLDSLE